MPVKPYEDCKRLSETHNNLSEDCNWESEVCKRRSEDRIRESEAFNRLSEDRIRESEARIRAFFFLRIPYFTGLSAKTVKTIKNHALLYCNFKSLYLKKE
jgi:hypothetical protein